jgi:hypothetical protein
LFLISVALVAGFWFHAEFYQLGLVPLLLVGGFLTFLVLLAVQRLATGKAFGWRLRWSLSLPRPAVGRGLDGTQTLAIVSLGAAIPPAGSLARVVLEDERPVARMRIEDVRRCLAEDLEESDAVAAGFGSLKDFRSSWSRGSVRDPHEVLLLVRFHLEAHR